MAVSAAWKKMLPIVMLLLEEALCELTESEIDKFDPEITEERLVNSVLAGRKLRLIEAFKREEKGEGA